MILKASGYQYAPALLMRMRELPDEERPEWPPTDGPTERYGLVPGAGS